MLSLLLATLLPARAAWMPPRELYRTYSQGVAALGAGELEEAEQAFREVLQRDPSCGMARHGLGISLLRQGQTGAALTELSSGAADFPDQPAMLAGLSTAAFVAQDFGRARDAAERAVKVDPADLDAQASLQQVLLRQGETRAARAALQAVSSQLPAPVVACFEVQIAVEVGDRKAAAALLPECRRAGTYDLVAAAESRVTGNAARSETTGDMASRMGVEHLVLMAQSIELYNSGDVAGAIAALDSVLESRPDQVDARVLRGRYRHTAGDKAGAIADLDQALKGSSWVEAHRSGALSGILRASDQDLLERMQSEGAELLVVLLIEKGDLSGAQTRLQTAREALGAEAALSAAQVRLHMAQGNLSGAWATADSGLKVWSRHETLLNAAGELALQDPSHLSPAVRQALTDSPRWSDRYNLALAAHKAGDISVCAQAATLAQVGAGSGRPEVARLAWTCAVEAGDLARADQALGSVADPPHSTAYNHALLRYNAGRKSEAWALLQPLLARPSGKASTDAALAALGLRCLADTHRYDEAVQLSTRKDISPADLVWLGGLLASQHRDPEALALLQRGCSALQAPDRRCTELLPELAQP